MLALQVFCMVGKRSLFAHQMFKYGVQDTAFCTPYASLSDPRLIFYFPYFSATNLSKIAYEITIPNETCVLNDIFSQLCESPSIKALIM